MVSTLLRLTRDPARVKHGFTNPDAGSRRMPELGYDANADKGLWQEMLTLFEDVLSN